MKRVFISDCEGPISKNDNAFELAANFVSNGDRLFSLISKYDDVLSSVLKKPGYNAGDTLKLILPFLKAFDVTDKQMRDYSSKNIVLITNIKESLKHIINVANAFIVSTSYEHYIQALCELLEFPFQNTFCTRFVIDKFSIPREEKVKLKEMAKEISQSTMITIPDSARSIVDFSKKDRETISRLDQIFWNEIMTMSIGGIYSEVKPIGGCQKAEAVKTAAKRAGVRLSDVVYVGDSITDVEAFKLVKSNGGLTVSFNGNQYAVRNADVAVMSESSLVTAAIAVLFCALNKQEVTGVLDSWSRETLKSNPLSKSIIRELFETYPTTLPKVKIVTSDNQETLVQESNEFRNRVRGQAIGRLG